jgi:hypothetical protein
MFGLLLSINTKGDTHNKALGENRETYFAQRTRTSIEVTSMTAVWNHRGDRQAELFSHSDSADLRVDYSTAVVV